MFSGFDTAETRAVGLVFCIGDFLQKRGIAFQRRHNRICDAPGCTQREHIEEHHLVYRSRGGGDEPANKAPECRFHHHDGEHGGLMRVRGTAPDGLVYRMGPRQRARWYRNERRIDQGS